MLHQRLCPMLRAITVTLTIASSVPALGQQAPGLPPAPQAPAPPAPPDATITIPSSDGMENDPYAGGMPPQSPDAYADTSINDDGQSPPGDMAMPAQDPPDRVGRVRVIEGRASLRPQGQRKWLDAASNRPLTPGDALYVGARGRAVVQLGTTTLYLGGNTAISVMALASDTLQVGMSQGDLYLHVGEMPKTSLVEVDLPGMAAAMLEAGDYRLHRDSAGRESFVVWQGQGEARVGTEHIEVRPSDTLSHQQDKHAHVVSPARRHGAKADAFDQFCRQDLQRKVRAKALQYVSQDVVGYDDLEGHGTWDQATDYGPVWTPTQVAASWAPYRYGHWAYIPPWGYTWVDDAAWGFAPFHYGRWVRWRNAWSWAPGPLSARPMYAPHLVSFLNAGEGQSVAWVPLGYGDPFVPGYGASYVYLRGINGGFVNLTGMGGFQAGYVNCGIPGAITVVPRSAWGGGVAIGGAFGTVGVGFYGPRSFGAPRPPGPPPAMGFVPRGARPGTAFPPAAMMQQPVMVGGPRLDTLRFGAAPGGRAGSPFIMRPQQPPQRPIGFQHFNGFAPNAPFRQPPIGRFEPMNMGHPAWPSVAHPGYGGHMGAPSYYGGGGHMGGFGGHVGVSGHMGGGGRGGR